MGFFSNMKDMFLLNRSKNKNVPFWSLKGKKLKCKPVHIYDGDTIHVVIILKNKPTKWKVRMLGYDSPEMKPLKTKENREKEIELAKQSRDTLSDWILNKIVDIEFGEFDKYGRPLGTIYIKNINMNQWMIDNGYGIPYDGKQKHQLYK